MRIKTSVNKGVTTATVVSKGKVAVAQSTNGFTAISDAVKKVKRKTK